MNYILLLISCGLLATAAGCVTWTLISLATFRTEDSAMPPFEQERRALLGEISRTYRRFEPLVDELAKINGGLLSPKQRNDIQFRLNLIAVAAWKPEEYLSVKQIEGVFAGFVVGVIISLQSGVSLATVAGAGIAVAYQMVSMKSLADNAAKRLRQIKHRLPFVVDMMALIIEAGGNFQDSLDTAVRENRDHPVGSELARVQREVTMGRPRGEAILSLSGRLHDQDVSEFVFAVKKGEELGTPLSRILRNQADQMRLKRSQWVEKAAAEAQVSIEFPGMIVMLACILLILAPIVLPAIFAALE